MAHKITDKIVGFSVVDGSNNTTATALSLIPSSTVPAESAPSRATPDPAIALETMNEALERQEELTGSIYKIKPPTLNHAIYVTINDIVLCLTGLECGDSKCQ